MDEIQVIKCDCDATCSGDILISFRGHTTLYVLYPPSLLCLGCAQAGGMCVFTVLLCAAPNSAVAHNAVAMTADEDTSVTTAGTGRGESLQSKLEVRARHLSLSCLCYALTIQCRPSTVSGTANH